MMRGARDALLPLLRDIRSLSTSDVAAQYAPAVKSSSGVFSWLSGGGSHASVPLSEPYPDVVIPKPDSVPSGPLAVKTSALPSGLKVAAFDAGGPTAGVAVFLDTASSNESGSNTGAAFLISQLAFSATKHRTTFRLVRELEKIGATPISNAGRDSLSLGLKVDKLHVPEATEILLDVAFNPRFNSWEVKDALPVVAAALDDLLSQPQTLLSELLHKTAFIGSIGHTLLPDIAALEKLTPVALHEFHAANFVPGKVLLVGSGIELENLQGLVQPLIGDSSSTSSPAASSKYVGGFVSALTATDAAHVAVAFEAVGGKSSAKSAATAAVAAALLSVGTDSIPFLEKATGTLGSSQVVLSLYKETGLIGLATSSTPADASKALDELSAAILKAVKGISENTLSAAKGKVLRAYAGSLTTIGILEDVGSQLLTAGSYTSGAYASNVAAVTTSDLTNFFTAAFKSAPTVVATGGSVDSTKYSEISKRFA